MKRAHIHEPSIFLLYWDFSEFVEVSEFILGQSQALCYKFFFRCPAIFLPPFSRQLRPNSFLFLSS